MPALSRSGNPDPLPDLIEHPDWIIACAAIESYVYGDRTVESLELMHTIFPMIRWMIFSSYLAPLCTLPDPVA